MAKKTTPIIETVSAPVKKKTPVKKTTTISKKTATATRLRSSRKPPVSLTDAKIKDLLEIITKMTVDYDKLYSIHAELQNEYTKSNQEKMRWESRANDVQIEFDALKKTYSMSEMTKNVLIDSGDKMTEELNTTRGLLTDANGQLNHINELLASKQREIENTNINYVKLNNLFTTASQENQQLRKELKELQDKWYNKLFNR